MFIATLYHVYTGARGGIHVHCHCNYHPTMFPAAQSRVCRLNVTIMEGGQTASWIADDNLSFIRI